MRELSVLESRRPECDSELTPALAAVMFKAVWNFAFNTSNLLMMCKRRARKTDRIKGHLQAIGKSPQKKEDGD